MGREAAGVWACSLCHYPNGKGRPENASVVGLPKDYFIQQMYDFKNGLRVSAEPRKPNTPLMTGFAVAMTDEEIRAAAEYFSSMRWTPWIEVVETDTVPKTRIAGGMHLKARRRRSRHRAAGQRASSNRPSTPSIRSCCAIRARASSPTCRRARSRAARRWRVYGNEGVTACTVCHGEDLDGLAMVPGLRGRSPSYIARQLADMKDGKRRGAWTPLMAPVVASLGGDDILNLAAYLTSLEPLP